MEAEWSRFRQILTVFVVFIAAYTFVKYQRFKMTYEPYINGSRSIPGMRTLILVSYKYRADNGSVMTDYYSVPSLARTPEWQELELLKLLFASLLPWAVPKYKIDWSKATAQNKVSH